MTELVLGLCLQERGDGEGAAATLTHAAELADRHGIPATGWEAHFALARLGDDSARHLAAAEAIVIRIAAEVKDPTLRKSLRKRVEL
jgi:hypothetical protein